VEHVLELNEKINSFSDTLLIKKFKKKPVSEGEFNYYPVFAKRLKKFKNIIFEELISERNTKVKIRTFKPSWYIAILVLDYCSDDNLIKEMVLHIKNNWGKEDYESFVDYISKEDRFYKYFK